MTSSTPQRELLLRYLLHRMEPLEREEIDIRLIADPEFAAAFQEAQNGLVDDYAAGVLSAEDQAKVREAMLANVAFARAVQMAAAFKLNNWQPRTPAKQGMRFRVPYWAVAACAVLILGGLIAGSLWLQRSVRPAQEKQAAKASAPAASAAAAPSVASLAHSASPGPAETRHAQPAALVATLVLPEATRSDTFAELRISRGMKSARIEWPVSAEARGPVMLQVFQGATQIAAANEAEPRRTVDGTSVARFILPSDKLQAGKYTFRVVAANAERSGEPPLVETGVEVTQR